VYLVNECIYSSELSSKNLIEHAELTITRDFLEPMGVIPVIVVDDASQAVPIVEALKAGGIKAVEVTLRTAAALDSIRKIKAECGDLLLGVGTVLNRQNLRDIANIGVDFVVSPGFTPDLIKHAQDAGLEILPGVSSPSEVMRGIELGLSCFKLFPAVAVGGLSWLKSVAAPLPEVSFCPTGGLTIDTFVEFLALPNVACVGGTWLVPKDAVKSKNWRLIQEIATLTTAKLT